MKHAHSITSLLLKLFLVGSSQIFCASWAQAQSSSLSELGAAPEDSLSASPPWQQLLSDLSSSEDFEHVAWQDYEEDLEEMAQHPVNLNTATREELERMPFLTASQVEDILFYIYLCHHPRLCGVWRVEDGHQKRRIPIRLHLAGQQDRNGTRHIASRHCPEQCRICKQRCAESRSIEHYAPCLQHHSGNLVDRHRRMPLLLQAQQEAIQADHDRSGE